MMFLVPRPSRSNGVKLHTIGDHQIGIEYTKGEPHIGKMAYDSQCGILSKNITFRRPDIDRIIADAVRQVDAQDAMPKAGKPRSLDMKADTSMEDDDGREIISKLRSYLAKYLDPEQMEGVDLILSSADAPDSDAGEPHNYQAADRGLDRREQARLAADQAARNYRRLCAATAEQDDAEFLKLFPNANRLLHR